MIKDGWNIMGLWQSYHSLPHENQNVKKTNGGVSLIATWRSNFDCSSPTQYWYYIKDRKFDLQSIRAKERYEINKGIKNFYVKMINIEQYESALYDVYVESLKGYENAIQLDVRSFFCRLNSLLSMSEDNFLFGVFDKENNNLCVFSILYRKDRYIE